MTSLCATFEELAARTWDYLHAAHESAIRIGEESLTDINLIELDRRHGRDVKSHKFTKAQEAGNGADWEWWFIGGGDALGIRVQAKKLYPRRGYSALSGAGRSQCARFLCEATKAGVSALYCFYNFLPYAAAGDWPRLGQLPVEQMGCALTPARTVKAIVVNQRMSPTVDALRDCQVPWRNLICLSAQGCTSCNSEGRDLAAGVGDDVGRQVLERIQDNLRGLLQETEEAEPPGVLETSRIPEYVATVREGQGAAYKDAVPARRVTVFELDAPTE